MDPTVDYLRVASLCVKAHCSTFHYCCINNARPIHLYSSGSLPDPGDIYAVNSGGLLIEHGLGEWYDVHWDLDEDHPTHCAPGLSGEVDDGGFSLFHHTGH